MEHIIKGKKVKMTQIFTEEGKVIPVTVIRSEEKVDLNLKNRKVVVTGVSKGKGFAGVMKRWGFAGGQATRGQSNKPRSGGSIGAQTPGRVFKGKKMAGRLGNAKVTVKGLKIVDILEAENIFMISGPVPGAVNAKVKVTVLE